MAYKPEMPTINILNVVLITDVQEQDRATHVIPLLSIHHLTKKLLLNMTAVVLVVNKSNMLRQATTH